MSSELLRACFCKFSIDFCDYCCARTAPVRCQSTTYIYLYGYIWRVTMSLNGYMKFLLFVFCNAYLTVTVSLPPCAVTVTDFVYLVHRWDQADIQHQLKTGSLLWWEHGGSLLLSEPSAVGRVVHISHPTTQVHISFTAASSLYTILFYWFISVSHPFQCYCVKV